MTQVLDPRRFTRRTLGDIRTTAIGAEVEEQRLLLGQRRQFLAAVHHAHGEARRVEQAHDLAAARDVRVLYVRPGRPCEPVQVGPLGGTEHRTDEAGGATTPDHHAGRAREGTAQPELALGTGGDPEAEVTGEDVRPVQVGLLELQPGQVSHLDHRVAGPSGALAP